MRIWSYVSSIEWSCFMHGMGNIRSISQICCKEYMSIWCNYYRVLLNVFPSILTNSRSTLTQSSQKYHGRQDRDRKCHWWKCIFHWSSDPVGSHCQILFSDEWCFRGDLVYLIISSEEKSLLTLCLTFDCSRKHQIIKG